MEHPIIIDYYGKIANPQGQGLIARYLGSSKGRAALAAAMAAPIRRSLDYHGIARRALVVDPLPQGALPIYDRDRDIDVGGVSTKDDDKTCKFEHDEVVISPRGKIGRRSSFPFARRVVVPEFEVYQNPTIRISDIKERRFNLIDRVVKLVHDKIIVSASGKIEKVIHGIRRRRFNVIDRAVQKARQEIMAQEDAAIFAALDAEVLAIKQNK